MFYGCRNPWVDFKYKFIIFSTHLLTVLIMRVILQIEQRKRDKRKGIPDVRRTRNDNTADWIVKI